MARSSFTEEVIACIREIPEGKVATYGGIAALAGSPRAARQVVRILHIYGAKEDLPWHRVVNKQGFIALKPMQGYEQQRELLEDEKITFDAEDRIDLGRYLWQPDEDDYELYKRK